MRLRRFDCDWCEKRQRTRNQQTRENDLARELREQQDDGRCWHVSANRWCGQRFPDPPKCETVEVKIAEKHVNKPLRFDELVSSADVCAVA